MPLCLLVEDQAPQRAIVGAALRSEGYEVAEAANGADAVTAAGVSRPEIVLLDLGLPDTDGIDLIPRLLAASPLTRIVVLTGRDSVSVAVSALRAGARHYLVKPWDLEELLLVVARECQAVDFAEAAERGDQAGGVFWGSHSAMARLRRQLEKLAGSPFTPVLIEGETGTGKEMVARELHRLTAPPGGLVAVNSAGIPGELLESELFGHEKGAFTGAQTRRRGMVELARDGTLFLDEAGEMSLALQAKLLRFLDGHRFRRVGGEQELTSPCRVVAATHRDLELAAAEGGFRQDLFFRLAVVRLRLPRLRDRREDIVPLAYFLLEELAASVARPRGQLSPAAEIAITRHAWPGNVRELRNRLERALVLGEDRIIQPADLDLPALPALTSPPRERSEGEQLRTVLEDEAWNVARAARRLGVPRHWLRYRMAKHGLHK